RDRTCWFGDGRGVWRSCSCQRKRSEQSLHGLDLCGWKRWCRAFRPSGDLWYRIHGRVRCRWRVACDRSGTLLHSAVHRSNSKDPTFAHLRRGATCFGEHLLMSFDPTAPFVSRRPFLLMGWLSVLCLSGGCTLLIGAEKRVEEEPGATGPIDEETQISTNDLCIEYCDEVMDHCTGGSAVYASRSSCINTCNALPPGEAAEPSGNTVQCRLRRARGAASAPDEECVAAGPGG